MEESRASHASKRDDLQCRKIGQNGIHGGWKPEAADLLEEALIRGEFERGDAAKITRLPERTARRVLIDGGLLASNTEKGPVSLRFPADSLDMLFPRSYPEV
jgi:hypothetical protein